MVQLISVTYKSENRLANLLATKKYLGIKVVDAKHMVQCCPCIITFNNPKVIESKLNLDTLKQKLNDFEIEITTINS
ncbi:hypothetical protein [Intestinibacter sp.]|uniref:hypothetical protein n=1 Tax=Intestinibacter sp. TaxID=1965304 RepID=UPI003F15719D